MEQLTASSGLPPPLPRLNMSFFLTPAASAKFNDRVCVGSFTYLKKYHPFCVALKS